MLLTSPLIVTVGLSLTIPLSLIGQMILDSQYSSVMYWFGAAIVLLSFIFINHEESKDEQDAVIAPSGILREETLAGTFPR
jgi:solute carrier family 35 protein F5